MFRRPKPEGRINIYQKTENFDHKAEPDGRKFIYANSLTNIYDNQIILGRYPLV